MARVFAFPDADSLAVVETDAAGVRGWTLRADQVAKHRAMFDADLSVADKAKCDAIAVRAAEAARVEAAK